MVAAVTNVDHQQAARTGDGSATERRITYVPALDGLRAVAVLVVIGYHHSPTAMPGGFLGVSTFFVLSGFLIGSLCFAEVARTGSVRAGRFWVRRVRRLLPAALLTILGVVAMGRIWGVSGGPGQRGDLLAALTWCANWRFLAQDSGYQAAFADPSPVQHFWSLAIEEQFYVLFPAFVLGIVYVTRRRWPAIRALVGVLTVTALGLGVWVAESRGFEHAYYATYTRAGELLVGVTLAALLAGGSAGLDRARGVATTARVAAAIGLVGMLVLARRAELGAPDLFSGLIPLNALCTVSVVVGCLLGGPVAALLAVWPLRMLGRISYGLYLFHWPLFLLLDEERTGLHGAPLLGVRLAVTLGCAVASYHLLEAPIRFRRPLPGRLVAAWAVLALVAVALVIVAVPPRSVATPGPLPAMAFPDDDPGSAGAAELTDSSLLRPERATITPRAGAASTAHLLVIGDSVADTLLPGIDGWNQAHPQRQVTVDKYTQMGCPLRGGAERLELAGRNVGIWPACQLLVEAMGRAVPDAGYDGAVVVIGLADLGNRKVGDHWEHIGQPAFDRRLRARMDGLADALAGTPTFWATYPEVEMRYRAGRTGNGPFDENRPERLRALNHMIRATAATHPDVAVLDLNRWCASVPAGCLDRDLRPDGVHFSWAGSEQADAWAMPRILDGIDRAGSGS